MGVSLERSTAREWISFLQSCATTACKQGIDALDAHREAADDCWVQGAIRDMMDGTDPDALKARLEREAGGLPEKQRSTAMMIAEAMFAIQIGTRPEQIVANCETWIGAR